MPKPQKLTYLPENVSTEKFLGLRRREKEKSQH
jgi:hypothetical protein